MSAPVMAFAQFVATGRDVADLRTDSADGRNGSYNDCDKPVPGRVYCGEDGPSFQRAEIATAFGDNWCWFLLIGNDGGTYYDPTPEGLEACERALYEWARSEGHCDLPGDAP